MSGTTVTLQLANGATQTYTLNAQQAAQLRARTRIELDQGSHAVNAAQPRSKTKTHHKGAGSR